MIKIFCLRIKILRKNHRGPYSVPGPELRPQCRRLLLSPRCMEVESSCGVNTVSVFVLRLSQKATVLPFGLSLSLLNPRVRVMDLVDPRRETEDRRVRCFRVTRPS